MNSPSKPFDPKDPHAHHAHKDRQGADCEIPEINTNFMDNLFQDSGFLKRFDEGFTATVPMGLEPETPAGRRKGGEEPPPQDLLDIDFNPKPRA